MIGLSFSKAKYGSRQSEPWTRKYGDSKVALCTAVLYARASGASHCSQSRVASFSNMPAMYLLVTLFTSSAVELVSGWKAEVVDLRIPNRLVSSSRIWLQYSFPRSLSRMTMQPNLHIQCLKRASATVFASLLGIATKMAYLDQASMQVRTNLLPSPDVFSGPYRSVCTLSPKACGMGRLFKGAGGGLFPASSWHRGQLLTHFWHSLWMPGHQ